MKCDNALTTAEARGLDLQAQNAAEMQRMLAQMAQIVVSFDQRIKALESLLAQRVTVTSVQAKALNTAIQAQARALCDKHGFSYQADGAAFRRAILRDLKAQYGVADLHDIPAAYFDLAMQFVGRWSSFALVRKIREKRG